MFDSLYIIIEFGIGMAGFAGIVVALAGDPRNWTEGERLRVFGLIFTALLASFAAFCCLALKNYTTQEYSVRITSAVFFLVGLVFFPRQIYRTLYMARQVKENYSWKVTCSISVLSFVILFLSCTTALGFTQHLFFFFYSSLVLTLFFAGIIYIRLLLYRPAGAMNKIQSHKANQSGE